MGRWKEQQQFANNQPGKRKRKNDYHEILQNKMHKDHGFLDLQEHKKQSLRTSCIPKFVNTIFTWLVYLQSVHKHFATHLHHRYNPLLGHPISGSCAIVQHSFIGLPSDYMDLLSWKSLSFLTSSKWLKKLVETFFSFIH